MKTIALSCLLSLAAVLGSFAADPGTAAPDFHLKDLNGKPVSLSTLKGKVVVLEWVNYGCPFVIKHYDSGNLPALQKEAAGKEVVWITVNSSAEGKQGHHPAPEMAELAAKKGNAAAHFVIDADGTVGRAYGAKVTPHLFIIDAEGKVAYNGAIDSSPSTQSEDVAKAEPWFRRALEAVLAGKPVEHGLNKPYGCGVKYGG